MLYLLSYVVVEPSPIIMTPLRYSLPSLKIVLMLKLWLFHLSLLQMSWWHKWIITCGFVTCKSSILFLLRFLFIKKMVTMILKLSFKIDASWNQFQIWFDKNIPTIPSLTDSMAYSWGWRTSRAWLNVKRTSSWSQSCLIQIYACLFDYILSYSSDHSYANTNLRKRCCNKMCDPCK